MSIYRGVFKKEEDPAYWQEAMTRFPNGVPRFDSKAEAIQFTKEYCKRQAGSEPQFQHSITLFTTWTQIEQLVIPRIYEYDRSINNRKRARIDLNDNRFCGEGMDATGSIIMDYVRSRLDLNIHEHILPVESAINTLKYLFYHMKCGIYVMIRNSEVVMFCPFSNRDYTNTWDGLPDIDSIDGSTEAYYQEKQKYYRPENIINKSCWWANGNIICNELDSQGWGDHFNFQLKDMIAEVCNQRQVPDCEFFINKRDYPQLKYSPQMSMPVEPYGFIFNKDDTDPSQDIPLADQLYGSYAPIFHAFGHCLVMMYKCYRSFYSSDRFADIPIPPTEDWEAATGKVFPASFAHSMKDGELEVANPRDLFTIGNLQKFERSWDDKVPTAFFRGTATGGGTTVDTNQRLHLAELSYRWSFDPVKNGTSGASSTAVAAVDANGVDVGMDTSSSGRGFPYLDAKIVGWNMRDKKIASSKMTFLKKANFSYLGDLKKNFVEIYKQSTYKYIIYAEGHCAACRYGFMMLLGSVILKVESRCVAKEMWYFPLLRPYVDHVPVKADLSDLAEQIEWCRVNDDKCREIVANARALYHRMICREGILDYLQGIFVEISQRHIRIPAWAAAAPPATEAPQCRARTGMPCDDEDFCKACKLRKETAAKSLQSINMSVQAEDSKKKEIEELRKRKKQAAIEEFRHKRSGETELMFPTLKQATK